MTWITRTARSLPLITSLLLAAASPLAAAENPFEKEIQAFEKADQTSPPNPGQILFIGSSSIRQWKTLREDFPGKEIIPRGFGGSQISDSIACARRIILPYKPRQVVLYAGDNDLHKGKSPGTVFNDFRQLARLIHQELPQTRISFIAIKPSIARWNLIDKINDANRQVRELSQSHPLIDYIDISTPMLGPDGKPRAELLDKDELHLSPKGYLLWADIIRPYLK